MSKSKTESLQLQYTDETATILGDDVGMGAYTNRIGKTSIGRCEQAVAWLDEQVKAQGVSMSRATLQPTVRNSVGGGQGYGPAVVEFATAGTSGNETTTQLDAAQLTATAHVARVELLNTFADGRGADVFVPAPDFKDPK